MASSESLWISLPTSSAKQLNFPLLCPTALTSALLLPNVLVPLSSLRLAFAPTTVLSRAPTSLMVWILLLSFTPTLVLRPPPPLLLSPLRFRPALLFLAVVPPALSPAHSPPPLSRLFAPSAQSPAFLAVPRLPLVRTTMLRVLQLCTAPLLSPSRPAHPLLPTALFALDNSKPWSRPWFL